MSLQSRREYLQKIRGRYQRAGRLHKTQILNEFTLNCSYHRKHAVRLLTKPPRARRPSGPPRQYGSEAVALLKEYWLCCEQMCSKRLKEAAPDWLPFFQSTMAVREEVMAMSPATMDRLLKSSRVRLGRKRRCGTKPGSLLKKHIPIRTDNADITRVGYLEADTVAHCGSSMAGDFGWTLTFTDILSGWTQCRAIWNKGHHAIHQHLQAAEAESPFPWLAFDCDNGSEFLNYALWDHYAKRPKPVRFTRSRPYHKNDNAHVEQKNWSAVRQLVGYERLMNPAAVALLNDLYENEWHWLVNFFCPTFKLLEKKKVGSKYVKRYEKPRTPYARLLESPEVSAAEKEKLRAIRSGLNPVKLRRRIQQKLRRIFALNKEEAAPGESTAEARS
jgi:hypothetical protein